MAGRIEDVFFEECDECLALAEEGLAAFPPTGAPDPELVNQVFRAVHSIKGGAGAFGFDALVAFAHRFETAMDVLREGDIALSEPLLALLQRSRDTLDEHVEAARDGRPAREAADVEAGLAAVIAGEPLGGALPVADMPHDPSAASPPEPATAPASATVPATVPATATVPTMAAAATATAATGRRLRVRPTAAALTNGSEPLLLLRELIHLGGRAPVLELSQLPTLGALDPAQAYLAWDIGIPDGVDPADLVEVFDFAAEEVAVELIASAPSEGLVPEVADTASDTAPHADTDTDTGAAAVAHPAEPAAQSCKPLAAAHGPTLAAQHPPGPVQSPGDAPNAAVQGAAAGVSSQPHIPSIAPKAAPAPAETPPVEPGTAPVRAVRVDLDRVDRVVNLVGELVITQAMLAERLTDAGREASDAMSDLLELTRQLQDGVMAMRAQPIKTVFSRMPRLVRELESETGKRVQIETRGEATEVDKTVVERLGEPLTHMIRNAVDHGIERPEDRVAAGKPPHGVVRLEAEQRGSRIVITLADDGRGIDRARVRRKAIERGIIAAEAQLSDEEIDNLIFAPGFSTAESVSNISGRGVGMDVVRRSVQALGGRVSVSAHPGRGTTVTLTLPLTLAIMDGMIVTVGRATYIVPIGQIVEIIQPRRAQLKALGQGRLMLELRGTFVPVVRVADALGVRGDVEDPCQGVLILVESERLGRAALLVDAIRDQQQIVIKSLDANYGPVADVAGATILGDGRVALILDVDTMTAARADREPALAA